MNTYEARTYPEPTAILSLRLLLLKTRGINAPMINKEIIITKKIILGKRSIETPY